MNDILLKLFTDYVVPLVGSAIMIYGGHLLFVLKSKLNNDNVKMALDQLSKITKNVVNHLNQVVVADIKSKTADGKLSAEDMREIKARAVIMIKAQMQTAFLDLLAKNTIDVNSLINSEIESNVFNSKCRE